MRPHFLSRDSHQGVLQAEAPAVQRQRWAATPLGLRPIVVAARRGPQAARRVGANRGVGGGAALPPCSFFQVETMIVDAGVCGVKRAAANMHGPRSRLNCGAST